MDHPTSDWAIRYGLPDPGPGAAGLLQLAPFELTNRARAMSSIAGRIVGATQALSASVDLVRTGWSRDAAAAVTAGLLRAAESGGHALGAQARATVNAAQALDAARTAAQEAYSLADAAIARGDLQRSDGAELWPLSTPDAWVRSARIEVVAQLSARIERAQSWATEAVSTLRGSLAVDPRDGLSVLRGPAGLLSEATTDPSSVDDARNRAALAADLTGADPVRAKFAAGVTAAIDRATGSAPAGTAVHLLVYDPLHPPGQGGAAIAVGDVSVADDIAVLVPGVGNSPSDMSGAIDALSRLRADAARSEPDAAVAAVAWLDYDIPASWPHDLPMTPAGALADSLIATDGTDAVGGGARLARFVEGIRADASPSAHVTLIGHSYGSVVVSEAALRSDAIDDVVLLAAPGAGPGVRDAGDYPALPPDHVFALSFDHDPVTTQITDLLTAVLVPAAARLPGSTFGPDPASEEFGAQVIDAPSNIPAITLGTALASPGGLPQAALVDAVASVGQHPLTNYLAGAAGLAVGAVVVGRYTAVRTRRGR